MRTRTLAVAVIALLAVLLVAGQAQAGKAETELTGVEVETSTGSANATYSGKVKSKRKCRKGRKVTLIHDSDPPFVIGETTTDKNGKWEITGPYPPNPNDDRIIVKVSGNEACKGAKGFFNFYDES